MLASAVATPQRTETSPPWVAMLALALVAAIWAWLRISLNREYGPASWQTLIELRAPLPFGHRVLVPALLRPLVDAGVSIPWAFGLSEWLATITLKTATTIDGIFIYTYNHNRCDEGAWEGPYDDGTWRCTSMHLPDLGFQNDVWNLWVTSEFLQAYPIPVTTLGGTGLPDPDIPGGVVPQIAGTPTLADADWDACSWPATFLPDKAPMEDTPGDWGGPASLLADTWRFDKPSDLDLRLLLSTVQPRGYCGGEVP